MSESLKTIGNAVFTARTERNNYDQNISYGKGRPKGTVPKRIQRAMNTRKVSTIKRHPYCANLAHDVNQGVDFFLHFHGKEKRLFFFPQASPALPKQR